MTARDHAARRAELLELFNQHAPIGRHFGMRLSYEGAQAVFRMPYNPALDHALGQTHGGAIATMLDNAGWFTVAPYFETWIATVEFHVRLHRPVAKQELVARGRLVNLGRRLSTAEMEVRNERGRLVATGSGSFTVTSALREPPD